MAITSIYFADFNGNQAEVLMITASKGIAPSFDIMFNGSLDLRIPATRSWKAEQKMAIDYARAQLGLPEELEVAPAEVVAVAAAWAPSAKRQGKMALLYAEIAREAGATETPAELLIAGREHAAVWASYGREAFNNEFDRLVIESNEQCEIWDDAARSKVVFY